MKIYLDTNLWNSLCDQSIDKTSLALALNARNVNSVVSHQLVHELAKCFPADPERGKKLFSCVREFVLAGASCTKEVMNVLESEMWAIRTLSSPDVLLSAGDYAEFRNGIDRLASGEFNEEVREFVRQRTVLASAARSGSAHHLEKRADMRRELEEVRQDNLARWIREELLTNRGAALLANHIIRLAGGATPESQLAAVKYGLLMLRQPIYRVAGGLVRADLYYNWRCAHRGSNRSDLYDDMYHVLNAMYCDVYATREAKQQEYAALLLTPNTKVVLHGRHARIDLWLEGSA